MPTVSDQFVDGIDVAAGLCGSDSRGHGFDTWLPQQQRGLVRISARSLESFGRIAYRDHSSFARRKALRFLSLSPDRNQAQISTLTEAHQRQEQKSGPSSSEAPSCETTDPAQQLHRRTYFWADRSGGSRGGHARVRHGVSQTRDARPDRTAAFSHPGRRFRQRHDARQERSLDRHSRGVSGICRQMDPVFRRSSEIERSRFECESIHAGPRCLLSISEGLPEPEQAIRSVGP